jgi:hypothetical protein
MAEPQPKPNAWRALFNRANTANRALVSELASLRNELEGARAIALEVQLAQSQTNLALRERVAELEAALRYAGKHPEDCVAGEPGPCASHMAYLEVEAELAALRAGPSAGD